MRYALEYATMAFLMWQLPNLAAGFMNGQPSMDAGGVIGGARQAAGTAATAGAAVASGGTAAAAKVASTYGNAKATSYLAKNMPGSDTRTGYLKNFGKTMARQRFANSTIGKALMDGANHAMNQNEDYKNIRSGEAFRKPQKNRN
jgi:type IV secretion system protein TrbL